MLKQRKYDSIAYGVCTVWCMTSHCVRPHEHDKPAFSKNSALVFYGDRFSSRVPLPCDFSRYSAESWLFIACELTLPRAEYLTIIEEGWVWSEAIWRLMGIEKGLINPPSRDSMILQIIREQNQMAFFTIHSKEFLKHDRC